MFDTWTGKVKKLRTVAPMPISDRVDKIMNPRVHPEERKQEQIGIPITTGRNSIGVMMNLKTGGDSQKG